MSIDICDLETNYGELFFTLHGRGCFFLREVEIIGPHKFFPTAISIFVPKKGTSADSLRWPFIVKIFV